MSRWEMDGLRILAQYVKKAGGNPGSPDATPGTESLRVDGQGLIPRAGPNYCIQIAIRDDPNDHRFPVPPEFNRKGFFVILAADLPVKIPYGAEVTISVIETDRKGERILAQSPLRYQTV